MRAQELLDELGIISPDEIDVDAIAQYVGATVKRAELIGAEARIVGAGDDAIITVNEESTLTRQRFSVGHELGHWMFDRGQLDLSCDVDRQERYAYGTDKESLANGFASDLLLPITLFRPRLGKRPPTLDVIRDLGNTFTTSLTATARRVVELSDSPAMVVCSSKAKREWYKASDHLDSRLRPHRYLSDDTLAYSLLRNPGFPEATDEVDADAWIDHPRAAHFVVVESSVKVTPELVLTVLWWKDESQIAELDDAED